MQFLRRRKSGVVDIVATSPDGSTCMVAIVHDEPWEEDGSDLVALQERINDCLAFITGGQLDEMYPDSRELQKLVQVFYTEPPEAMTEEFFVRVGATLEPEGIGFEAEQVPED